MREFLSAQGEWSLDEPIPVRRTVAWSRTDWRAEEGEGRGAYIRYGDLPLGMFVDQHYHQHFSRFEPGDVMVLYTDGITEAASPGGEEYGPERLAQRVLDGIDMPARKLIDHIRKGIADFTESKFLDDDGTLFIIKAL